MIPWRNWILTAFAICFLLTLFPPYLGGNIVGGEKFIGFHFLFGTPKWTSPNEQVSRSYQHINGEKELVSEKSYYPKKEYLHSRIDFVRYTLLLILTFIILGIVFVLSTRPKVPPAAASD